MSDSIPKKDVMQLVENQIKESRERAASWKEEALNSRDEIRQLKQGIEHLQRDFKTRKTKYKKSLEQYRAKLKDTKNAVRTACTWVEEHTGDCPASRFDGWHGCLEDNCNDTSVSCWVRYFMGGGTRKSLR